MTLAANAIITVQQFLDFTGQTRVLSDAFTIWHDGTSGTATAATVTVTDTTVVLTVTGGANAGTSTLTLSDAANDTLAELCTVITALNKGWQVELLGSGTASSGSLDAFAATSALLQANTITAQYANTSIIEDWINASSQAVDTYLGAPTVAVTDQRIWVDGRGSDTLTVPLRPLTGVKRIAWGAAQAFFVQATDSTDIRATVEVQDSLLRLSRVASSGTETATSLAFSTYTTASALVTQINLTTGWSATLLENCMSLDLHRRGGVDALLVNAECTFPETESRGYFVDEGAGLVTLSNGFDYWDDCFPRFPRSKILVQADGGWALASVPADIVTAAWRLAQSIQNSAGSDSGMQSESLGDYSYTRAQTSAATGLIVGDIASLLAPYRVRSHI